MSNINNDKYVFNSYKPIMPKMSRMLGANITSMLMNVSKMRAMMMWRIQLKDLEGNAIS